DVNVTCDGNGKSPAVVWSNIPSKAKSLILIMDTIPGPPRPSETQSGNHYYLYKFNIPVTARGFAEGEIAPYAPPCSQGPGLKQYRIFLYALDRLLPSNQDFDAATLMKIGESEAIGKVMHSYGYVRKA
ncbi:MAG: hypothetical protein RL740_724, partial [Actinomycetota bacterium]